MHLRSILCAAMLAYLFLPNQHLMLWDDFTITWVSLYVQYGAAYPSNQYGAPQGPYPGTPPSNGQVRNNHFLAYSDITCIVAVHNIYGSGCTSALGSRLTCTAMKQRIKEDYSFSKFNSGKLVQCGYAEKGAHTQDVLFSNDNNRHKGWTSTLLYLYLVCIYVA